MRLHRIFTHYLTEFNRHVSTQCALAGPICLNHDAVYINRDVVFIDCDVVYKNNDVV